MLASLIKRALCQSHPIKYILESPMTDAIFNYYSQYYDLLYRDKDYVQETNALISLLLRVGVTGKDLLELGSGTGRHGRLLASSGYRVMGIERSAQMVKHAEIVSGFTCKQGDICTVNLESKFDAVIALFHVVSYQTTDNDLQSVFARASEHLHVGGVFVFDVWYSPAVFSQTPEVRVKRIADETVEITRIAEPALYPNENRVDVNYTFFVRDISSNLIKPYSEVHHMRHFSLPELQYLARINGFHWSSVKTNLLVDCLVIKLGLFSSYLKKFADIWTALFLSTNLY